MLTESRKRRRSCGSEEGQLPPLAKRSGGGQALLPEPARDVWDSESSSSDSSGISSPEQTAGGSSGRQSSPSPGSPSNSAPLSEERAPFGLGSYHHINRILREAHFSSLQTRGLPRAT
ncbi:hypothetical protein MATL_G00000620 [Megalops atlanticus]|uniref:Protein FAM104A n=1 Tax=Megalops atlanticus TaxID=7932 RepID=A0A9D3QJR8_MEGAT|nr:hypothetical protein MATL_G00000620 [Megalops atlanticus]